MSETHTPGALRAAQTILGIYIEPATPIEALAEIIDRETGLADLLKACIQAMAVMESTQHMLHEAGMEWGDNLTSDVDALEAAIKEAKP